MASVVHGLYKDRRLSRRVRDVKWEKLCELRVSTNGDLDNLGLAVISTPQFQEFYLCYTFMAVSNFAWLAVFTYTEIQR
jgi:hypothetical protein